MMKGNSEGGLLYLNGQLFHLELYEEYLCQTGCCRFYHIEENRTPLAIDLNMKTQGTEVRIIFYDSPDSNTAFMTEISIDRLKQSKWEILSHETRSLGNLFRNIWDQITCRRSFHRLEMKRIVSREIHINLVYDQATGQVTIHHITIKSNSY